MSDSFNKELTELKALEREILTEIKFRKDIKKEDNVYYVDKNIKKNLDLFQNKLSTMNSSYVQKYSKGNNDFSDKEATRRINLLQEMKQNYNQSMNTFNSLVDNKHKFTNNNNNFDDYKESEDMKIMSNKALFENQKSKLNNQNEQIDSYINITKAGRNRAKEITNEAENQIKLLEKVEIDIEKTHGAMEKTRGKFMRYIENSSNCCLLTVIFIELVLLFVVIFV